MARKPKTYPARNAAGKLVRVTIPEDDDEREAAQAAAFTRDILSAWEPVVRAAVKLAEARDAREIER